MLAQLPDPSAVARQEADRIAANRDLWLKVPVDRVIADSPQVEREALLAGIEEFHAERMANTPDPARYPESPPWVEHALAVDRELKDLAGLTGREMAIYRSLHSYLAFRGFAHAARPAADERCRGAYLPETDRGEMTISNADDPLTHWEPLTSAPEGLPGSDLLNMIGVGSGLHVDEEPEETFPLPVLAMVRHYTDDVPGGVEFLTRYCPFWGRCNIVLFDRRKRSCAIEKCSFQYIEVFPPGPDGQSHVSGMTCRDPNSTLGRHQSAMRQKYVHLFGLPQDGPDMAFWAACRKFEEKLAGGLRALGPRPCFEDLVRLFVTPWPEGLNKAGLRVHPQSGLVGYTLQTHVSLLAERICMRWQRSQDGKTYASEPEVYQF